MVTGSYPPQPVPFTWHGVLLDAFPDPRIVDSKHLLIRTQPDGLLRVARMSSEVYDTCMEPFEPISYGDLAKLPLVFKGYTLPATLGGQERCYVTHFHREPANGTPEQS
jgi:hypothetical protein